jgi:hypothetical protein
VEYRSHLARHASEGSFATQELADLEDDMALITSDYKMKILSCFFRENQKRWFGKRGTSMLGFMIATNPKDEAEKVAGMKDLKFVMMLTDDTLQDDWEVVCAKHHVLTSYVPDHIKRFKFIADGAGCFKSNLHKALVPFWKIWTGMDEVTNRTTPAGYGKSPLDGMFGRAGTTLGSAVDAGCSHFNAKTTLGAFEQSNGLASTFFLVFNPNRTRKLGVKAEGLELSSVLTTTLDANQLEGTHTLHLFKHSSYGSGVEFPVKSFGLGSKDEDGNVETLFELFDEETVSTIDLV